MSLLTEILDYLKDHEAKFNFKPSVIRLCREHNIKVSQSLKSDLLYYPANDIVLNGRVARLFNISVIAELDNEGNEICILCEKNKALE